MKIAYRALAAGVLSYVLPRYRGIQHHPHDARYFYSVFLRHLVSLHDAGAMPHRGTVAELGPGNALGFGLAALLSGWQTYQAFDVAAFASAEENRGVLAGLIELFTQRAPIPDDGEMPNVYPKLQGYAFPSHVLADEQLTAALAPARIEALQRSLAEGSGIIKYSAPWLDASVLQANTIDWVASQAVLEHVDAPVAAWNAIAAWLKPGGVTTHSIDFRSHGFTPQWNGHWACSDLEWRLLVGKRIYSLNRASVSDHRQMIADAGLDVLQWNPDFTSGGVARSDLAARFRKLSDDDIRTSGVFVIARKSA